MIAQQNAQIAERWFAAFNTNDLEGLLALYDDNAVHYSPKLKIRQPETNGQVTGKAALRAWWQDAYHRFPMLQYLPTTYTPNDDRKQIIHRCNWGCAFATVADLWQKQWLVC